jgi:hypothetical protein
VTSRGPPGPARERGPFEPPGPAPRPEEYRLPRRGPDEQMIPFPRADEPVPTAAFPGEHGTAADRARKRNAHGSHRGGHAKRRRG